MKNVSTYDTSACFNAISDPHRREILMLLTGGSRSINDIATQFDISRPAISKHIKTLTNTGFISIEEVGRSRHCVLKKDGFEALESWFDYFQQFWPAKMQQMEQLLNRNK